MFILGYLENQWHSVNFIQNSQALKASWACCLGENVFEMLLHTWVKWVNFNSNAHSPHSNILYKYVWETNDKTTRSKKRMQMVEKSVFASPWNINELFQNREKKQHPVTLFVFVFYLDGFFSFDKKSLNLSKIHRHDS